MKTKEAKVQKTGYNLESRISFQSSTTCEKSYAYPVALIRAKPRVATTYSIREWAFPYLQMIVTVAATILAGTPFFRKSTLVR